MTVHTALYIDGTQIYLTEQQRRRNDELASAEGMTMAEVIRRAVDGY